MAEIRMFTTEDEWSAAYTAAEDCLSFAVDQGYITYVTPEIRSGLSREIVKRVVLSVNGVNGTARTDEDILDGEFEVIN